MKIRLCENTNKIDIRTVRRQTNIISQNLFTLVLEDIFVNLNWQKKGLNILEERLSNLKLAEDIVLCAQNKEELTEKLHDLHHETKRVGLEINTTKTNLMTKKE